MATWFFKKRYSAFYYFFAYHWLNWICVAETTWVDVDMEIYELRLYFLCCF